MSDWLHWYVVVLVLANILGCWWLLRWTAKPRPGESAEGETTGHVWDGDLREYNNPLPRWWLWLFYATIVFGLLYLVLYPGLGRFDGALGWTQEQQYRSEMDRAADRYDPIFEAYAQRDIPDLATDPEALRTGRRLFLNNCATCHGSDAGGAPGFPRLTDDAWLYGGSPEAIKTTILDGRSGNMPSFEAALGGDGVEQVTAYVMSLSGRAVDDALAQAGRQKYQTFCVACHGPNGKGNQTLGAPDLTDDVWLYGGSPGIIRETLREGRSGRMPAHRDFLGEDRAHLVAAYVYSLSREGARVSARR